jgi:hypothetical protein
MELELHSYTLRDLVFFLIGAVIATNYWVRELGKLLWKLLRKLRRK